MPRTVVDEIVRQLEDGFKREGWRDITNEPTIKGQDNDRAYFKVDEPPTPRSFPLRTQSQEIEDRQHFINEYKHKIHYEGSDLDEVLPELGITRRQYYQQHADFGEKHLANLIRRGVMVPDGFKASRVVGICANPDPHSETFCVEFTQDGDKDEWRDTGDSTKTQFIRSGPGVHVSLCDFLEDVQRKVKAAGGDFEISDEGEYCDDEEGHKHDPREVVKAVEQTAQVINKIGVQLAGQGWEVKPSVPQQPSGMYPEPTGRLDDWLSMKSADLLITAPSLHGFRLLNKPVPISR